MYMLNFLLYLGHSLHPIQSIVASGQHHAKNSELLPGV